MSVLVESPKTYVQIQYVSGNVADVANWASTYLDDRDYRFTEVEILDTTLLVCYYEGSNYPTDSPARILKTWYDGQYLSGVENGVVYPDGQTRYKLVDSSDLPDNLVPYNSLYV